MNDRAQQIDLRLAAVLASLLLSAVFYFFTGIPNDDAYTYIRTAEIFLNDGLTAAIDHYAWVTYPVLIALVSSLGISLLTAAYVLNALFYALLVYSFVSIVRLLDDSRLVVALAALTVLVYPELNEYRDMVIRDVGFWSLSLFGLLQFLLYDRNRNFRQGLLFVGMLGLASLFRPEALLYLLLTPISLLFNSSISTEENRKHLLRLSGVTVLIGAGVLLTLLLVGINVFALVLDRLAVYQLFLVEVFNPGEAVLAARSDAIFGEFAADFSGEYVNAVIAAGLLVVLAMTLFYGIGGPYFWLLAWGLLRKHLPAKGTNVAPVLAYLLINLGLLLVFLYVTRFLTARYAILFSLLIVLQVPFLVRTIIENIRDSRWKMSAQYFLIMFFFYCAMDAYISLGRPRDWLMDAAQYVNESNAGNVITNNLSIAYFSGAVEAYDEVIRVLNADTIRGAQPGDLLAIEMFYDMRVLVADPAVAPYLEQITGFPQQGEQRVAIFRRVAP